MAPIPSSPPARTSTPAPTESTRPEPARTDPPQVDRPAPQREVDTFQREPVRPKLALVSGGGAQQPAISTASTFRVGYGGGLVPTSQAAQTDKLSATSGAGASDDAALKTDINDQYTQQLGRPCEDPDAVLAQARASGAESPEQIHDYVSNMIASSPEKAALSDINAQFEEKLGRSLTVPQQAQWLKDSALDPSSPSFHDEVARQITSSEEYKASHPNSGPSSYYTPPPKELEQNLPSWALPAPEPTGVPQVDVALSHYGELAADAVNGRGLDPTFNERYTTDTHNSCANFVSACCEKAGLIAPGTGSASVQQMRTSMLNQGFTQVASVPTAAGLNQGNCQIGDVICLHDPTASPPYVHTEMVAGFDANGNAVCIGNNNLMPDDSQVVSKDSYTWAARQYPNGQFEILRPPASKS